MTLTPTQIAGLRRIKAQYEAHERTWLYWAEALIERADALLDAAERGMEAEGFKLVPIQPSFEMLRAGNDAEDLVHPGLRPAMAMYEAMIAAAHTPGAHSDG